MNVILIANLSANGKVLLAENPDHTAPPEALGFFIQKAIEAGNLIIGRKTFEMLKSIPGGIALLFPNVEIIILTSSDQAVSDHQTVDSPEKAIAYLDSKGFKDIIVGGGAITYNAFLEKDLVNEIYFNTIPMIIGDGGIIGNVEGLKVEFKITEHRLLADNIAQLHLKKSEI